MCAENGGWRGWEGLLDGCRRARNHQSLQSPAEGGRRRRGRRAGRGRGKNTVTAGWATGGDECVIRPSLLPPEQHVQDMGSKRPETRRNMSPITAASR